jgi:2,3-bisphosphoglycerate-dependent phosphoglycerate mutase
MNRPTLLVLVRHGESQRNFAKKGSIYFADDESRKAVRGVPDHEIPLTDEGRRQSEVTGRALHERFGAFDYLYHSGYRRTVETAEHLLSSWPAPARERIKQRHNLFIRERDAGHAYDMTTAEAEAAFPWLHEYWTMTGGFFAHPPGGESLAQVCERVHLFLDMIFTRRVGQRVLVVTHGGTLRAFRFLLEHWNYEEADRRFKLDPPHNCSVTTYEYDQESSRLTLAEYNRVYWQQP